MKLPNWSGESRNFFSVSASEKKNPDLVRFHAKEVFPPRAPLLAQ